MKEAWPHGLELRHAFPGIQGNAAPNLVTSPILQSKTTNIATMNLHARRIGYHEYTPLLYPSQARLRDLDLNRGYCTQDFFNSLDSRIIKCFGNELLVDFVPGFAPFVFGE